MKTLRFFVFTILFSLAAYFGYAQPAQDTRKGKIIFPVTPRANSSVLDPKNDGWVTATGTTFPDQDGGYNSLWDLKMFGIPQLGGDAERDNVGQPCGITDLIPGLDDPTTEVNEKGYSVYARRFDDLNKNIMFRFRVGNNNPSVEAWTILLDVDGKFGFTGPSRDPNATADNPGFEIDITLIKRQNAGVFVYNIDGTSACTTPLINYSIQNYFQIAVADITTCGDLDYFYDFYVPFEDVAALFNNDTQLKLGLKYGEDTNNDGVPDGITGSTPLRYASVTNTSATCAMDGKIADVSGIDDSDPQYASIPYAFEQIINAQCGTPINDLEENGPGFNTELPYSPTINPVKSGVSTVSGTVVSTAVPPIPQSNVDDIYVLVSIFSESGILRESKVALVTDGIWSASLTTPLQAYDVIRARVQLNVEGTGCGTGAGNEVIFKVLVVPDFAFQTDEDKPLTGSLNPNSSNFGTEAIFSPGSVGPLHGSVTINPNGSFTYTPDPNYFGADEFKYSLCADIDNEGDPECGEATVKITILPVNDTPDAINDIGSALTEDGANGSVNIISNDIDVDGNPTAPLNGAGQFTVDLDLSTAGLQTTFNSNGIWTLDINTGIVSYDPANNYFGTSTIFYTLCDAAGACDPESASITFTVTAVNNDPPVANDDIGANLIEDGVNGTVDILANDTDPDGKPTAPVNDAGQFSVDIDLATPLIQTTITNATGNWTFNVATGILTFNPADNYYGTASINYRLTDPQGLFDDATITFIVTPVADAPIAIDDNGGVLTEDGVNGVVDVLLNDSDPDILPNGIIVPPLNGVGQYTIDLDVNTSGVQSTLTNTAGVWTLNTTNGQVTFDPATNFGSSAIIVYQLCDTEGLCDNANIIFSVTPQVDDPPVANDDTGNTLIEDGANGTVSILTNDTDPDGNPVAPVNGVNQFIVDLDIATSGVQTTFTNSTGTWTLDNSTGVVTFNPADNYNGTAVISYRLTDPQGNSDDATITFVVTPVSDNPIAINDTQSTNQNTPVTLSITANDYDPDQPVGSIDAATVDLDPSDSDEDKTFTVTGQGVYAVDVSGNLTFTPTAVFNGTATAVNYTVKDNEGNLSNVAQILVTVLSVNNPPVANNDTAVTDEDNSVTFSITNNDTDSDGIVDPSTVDLDPSDADEDKTFTITGQGTFTVDDAGNVTFVPVANYNGITTPITYTVKDNSGGLSNTATIRVTVNPVNDKPVAFNATHLFNLDQTITFTLTGADVDGNPLSYTLVSVSLPHTFTGEGVLTGNPALPNLQFDPDPAFIGSVTFTFKVNDGSLDSDIATITLRYNNIVGPQNPVAVDDLTITTNEDQSVSFSIIANDSDTDGNIVPTTVDLDPSDPDEDKTFTVVGKGTFTVDATGTVTFVPALNYNGLVTILYTVKDNSGLLSNTATIKVDVLPVGDSPIAVDDLATTNESTPVTFSITTNDYDPDQPTGSIDVTTVDLNPATVGEDKTFTVAGQGTYNVDNSGNLTFTPVAGYYGTATAIAYTVKDNDGNLSNEAKIQITIQFVNDAPVANDDILVSTDEDVAVTFSVIDNDVDSDGIVDPSTVDLDPSDPDEDKSFTVPGVGVFTVDNSGKVTFTPAPDYNGTTSPITYTVKDNGGALSNPGTIQIIVNPIPDNPVAVNDSKNTSEDTAVTFSISSNDYDPDQTGSIIPSTIDLDPSDPDEDKSYSVSGQGIYTVNASGELTFTPDANFFGAATPVKYTIKDNDGALSNEGQIQITVLDINDPPVAVNDQFTTQEDVAGKFNIVNNTSNSSDTDADGIVNPATVDLDPTTPAEDKTFSVTGEGTYSVDINGLLTFTPALNYNGTTTPIKYTVKDNSGALSNEATIQVIVTPVNDAPVVPDATVSVDEDESVTVCVTYTDIENDPAVLKEAVSQSGKGKIVLDPASGALCFIYTPDSDFNGTDTVPVVVCDKNDPTLCSTGTITININPVNDPPRVIVDSQPVDTIKLTTPEDTPLPFCFDTDDLENNNISIGTITNVSGGGTLIPGTGSAGNSFCFVFTPDQDFTGKSNWTISICDDGNPNICKEVTIEIEVTPLNDPPVAQDQTVTTNEDTPKAITLVATDPDGDVLVYSVVNNPVHGSLSGTGSNLVYTPNLDFNGSDSFTFRANDGALNSNLGTVTIQVLPVNDPAVITDIPNILVPEDSVVQVCIGAIDPEGDELTYNNPINVSGGGTMTRDLSNAFCFNFRPAKDFNGESKWKFTVCDNGTPPMCIDKEVTIIVTPVNDPPIAVNDYIEAMSFKKTDAVNILANDKDIENDKLVLTTTAVAGPYHGTVTMKADGSFEYRSALGYMGPDSVRYKVCDTGTPSLCDEGVVFIEVGPAPFKIYEGLSPNGDGLNDYWRIDGIEAFPNNTVRVFDRYNNLIFEMKGYDNDQRSWTGQSNHSLVRGSMSEGTYYYTVDLGDGSDLYTGYVVLKRN